MNTPTEKQVTRTRYQFHSRSPYGAEYSSTIRDLEDAIMVAMRRLVEVKGAGSEKYDDALRWYVDDDGIVLFFEVEA